MTAHVRNTILVVDDMVSNRMYLRNILKEEYDVIEAGNGEQALQQLQFHHGRIAAVLLDLMMPVKNGVETLEDMGKLGYLKEFPVIVVTADDSRRDEARILEMGASDMVYKPYDPVVIKRRIANLVTLFAGRRSLESRADDLSKTLDASNMRMVTTLAAVTEFRSLESGLHTLRIKSFARILLKAVAEHFPEYHISQREIDLISNASVLHDIGKVTIPDNVLNKPGKLTKEEFEIMKTHTTAGSEILLRMKGPRDDAFMQYAYNICRYHHERWDGRGYPDGLKKENIPLCAQVVGICDVYDALTTDRVYKAAFPHDVAVDMILRGECGVFNPKMLSCFVQVLGEFKACARDYADSKVEPMTEELNIPAPLPASTEQDLETERISAAKCRALYQIVNGVIMELDMNAGTYELDYDADGEFAKLRNENKQHDLNEVITSFIKTIVHPEDRVIAAEQLLNMQKDFFEDGLSKQVRNYRVWSPPSNTYIWVEACFLRIYTGKPKEKRAFCIWRRIQPEGIVSAAQTPDEKAHCENQLRKLPGVLLRCHRDKWMTVECGQESLSELVGYSVEELDKQFQNRLMSLVLPEDQEMVYSGLQKAGQYGMVAEVDYRLCHKDGSVVWITDKNRITLESDGEERVYHVLFDNTQPKKELKEARIKLERQQLLLNNASEIFFEWDLQKDEISFTDKFKTAFGYPLKSNHFSKRVEQGQGMVHPEDLPRLREMIKDMAGGASSLEQEMRLIKADGTCLWCRIRMVSQQRDNGNTASILGAITDINADKMVLQNLQYQSERDSLTGLFNRATATKRVEEYLQKAKPTEKAAVLILDIDNFKNVNDTYGHMAGDSVLIACGDSIRHQFRKNDIVSRLGGDEFMVCLLDIPDQKIAQISCEKLLKCFSRDIAPLVPDCGIACSVGVAMYPADGKKFFQLVQNADKALRFAKEHGKNQYAVYSDVDEERTVYQSTRTAIDSNHRDNLSKPGLIEYTLHSLYQSGDLEGTIQKLLKVVGMQTNVSRVYIFENSPNSKYCSNTFEWCNEGIRSVQSSEQHISYESVLKNLEAHYVQSNTFYCRDVSELPHNTRKLMDAYGVKSFVHCALRDDHGEFRGFVGFSDCVVNRLWTKEQLAVLESFAELVSLSLLKKRAQDNVNKWAEGVLQMLNSSEKWIYAVDPKHYIVRFINEQMQELIPELQIGDCCYETIMNRTSPCEQCPIQQMQEGDPTDSILHSERLKKTMSVRTSEMSWDGEDMMLMVCQECRQEAYDAGQDPQ